MEQKEREPQVIKVVAGVIFNRERDSVLCGQRAKGKEYELKWEFIGGKVNLEENILDAGVREIGEEVALPVEAENVLGEIEYDYGGKVGKVDVVFVEYKIRGDFEPVLNPEVHRDLKWVHIPQLPELDWLDADKDFVKKLVEESG